MSMTIAQALRRIAKLKGSIGEHYGNAIKAVSYDTTKVPVFSFDDELALMRKDQEEMVDLQTRVAVANANTSFQTIDGLTMSLVKAIKSLDETKGLIKFYTILPIRNEKVKEKEQEWNEEKSMYVNITKEVEFVSALTEKDRTKKVSSLKDSFEELNNLVEDLNHRTEV